jgi:hypothetical protein
MYNLLTNVFSDQELKTISMAATTAQYYLGIACALVLIALNLETKQ